METIGGWRLQVARWLMRRDMARRQEEEAVDGRQAESVGGLRQRFPP